MTKLSNWIQKTLLHIKAGGLCMGTWANIKRPYPIIRKSIELDLKNADAYYGKGYAEADMGKTEDAKKDLQKALELNPDLKTQVKDVSDYYKLGL